MLNASQSKTPIKKTGLGRSWPLGSSLTERGVNFSVAAPNATHLQLVLFNQANDTQPEQIIELNKEHKSGYYWHVEVEGLGLGACYAYKVFGLNDSKESKFWPEKVLLDPCARAVGGWDVYQRELTVGASDNLHACLKGMVCDREQFNFDAHPRPKHPWQNTVIYELHVGGFTNQDEANIESAKKGTFLGLIEKIPYLSELGITTIELLPVFLFDTTDAPYGLENYWGYSPLNWFTPHNKYISGKDQLAGRKQFKELVSACHDEGIEVLLDVVYNHTTEGDINGPNISWRGFDPNLYYHQNQKGAYLDVSGCGNSVAANRPLVRQLILESMRCWANELGVDGFRFDLGIALSRGEELLPLKNPPLFEEIEADPILSELKLISEPWDCGGLYQLSDFPARRFRTWNGHFRDDIRRFWKGDKNTIWPLKERLRGSEDLYQSAEDSTRMSINFITSHDGFTLNDLVSFNSKHNLANSEDNRDGENHNNAWNHGVEGPSNQPELTMLRTRQKKNFLASLLLSPGVPMILMGDELNRSQGGNNNTWCQNNQLSWMIWNPAHCDLIQKEFVRKLIAIRSQLSCFFNNKIPTFESSPPHKIDSNKLWLQWHGIELKKPDWGHWSHTISYSINRGDEGAVLWMGLNAYSKEMLFELPLATSQWKKVIDTSLSSPNDLQINNATSQNKVELESRSLVLMITEEHTSTLKL